LSPDDGLVRLRIPSRMFADLERMAESNLWAGEHAVAERGWGDSYCDWVLRPGSGPAKVFGKSAKE